MQAGAGTSAEHIGSLDPCVSLKYMHDKMGEGKINEFQQTENVLVIFSSHLIFHYFPLHMMMLLANKVYFYKVARLCLPV